MARLDFIAILMLEPRLQWIIKLLFNYKQNICASLGVSTAGCAGGRSEDSSAGIARPGMSLPITIRAAWLRPARALSPFSLLCLGTLLPVTSQTPAAAPAGSAPPGLLFRHVFVPQALKLLQKGAHHVSTQTRKGITLRSALGLGRSEVLAAGQRAVLTQGTAPLRRVPAEREDHSLFLLEIQVYSSTARGWGGSPFPTCLLLALILAHLWWGVQGSRPGGSELEGASPGATSWPLSRCGLGTIPNVLASKRLRRDGLPDTPWSQTELGQMLAPQLAAEQGCTPAASGQPLPGREGRL